MAEGKEPSFGRLVFNRAWFAAWGFFDSWRKDTALGLVSLAVGEYSYYRDHGLPGTIGDGAVNAVHLVAPLVLVWVVLFVWHFWLAPSALAYEAAKEAAKSGKAVPGPAPSPEKAPPKPKTRREILGPWAQVDRFKVGEAACLWAGFLPGGMYEVDKMQKGGVLGAERLISNELESKLDLSDVRSFDADLHNAYVTRADLLGLAERKGVKPGFLYPDG